MKEISSRENQKIRNAARLKEQKYRNREQMFLIEGKNLFVEAVRKGHELIRVFVEYEQAEEYIDYFQQSRDVDWIKVDNNLMKYICDTRTPQGIAAIVKMPRWDLPAALEKKGMLLFLDRIGDPGNMGTILRTAWAFGIQGIMLGSGCVDAYSSKVVRAGMGAVFHVPVFNDISMEELLHTKEMGYQIIGSSLDTDVYIESIDFRGPVIVVIGSEAHGISSDIVNLCDQNFKIPINTPVDSLNVGVACGIIVYEAGKQRER